MQSSFGLGTSANPCAEAPVEFPEDMSHSALCKAAGNGMHLPSVAWAMLVNIVCLERT